MKRIQQPLSRTRHRSKTYGRFPPGFIYHADQVPLEFGGFRNATVDIRGAKRSHAKTPKIDVTKRWATLQLCFNAAGPKVNPGICFNLQPKKLPDGSVDNSLPEHSRMLTEHNELSRQYPGVDIYYKPKACALVPQTAEDTSTAEETSRR